MDFAVRPQISTFCELLVAMFALKWLFTSVSSDVDFERA